MSIKEEILNFGRSRSIVAILTSQNKETSIQALCVIFINAGLIHKMGPNRLYVKMARELAMEGNTCFRFDYAGKGDSESINSTANSDEIKNGQIVQAMDAVQSKTGISQFVLLGICSGAEDAFRVSVIDDRIVGLSLIDGVYQNELSLQNIGSIAMKKHKVRYYKKYAFNLKRWKKIITGKSGVFTKRNFTAVFEMIISIFRRLQKKSINHSNKETCKFESQANFNIDDWKLLFERKVKIHLVFCEGGTAIDIFNLTIGKQLSTFHTGSLLKFQLIKNVDHTFTPQWSQDFLSNITKDWMSGFVQDKKVLLRESN